MKKINIIWIFAFIFILCMIAVSSLSSYALSFNYGTTNGKIDADSSHYFMFASFNQTPSSTIIQDAETGQSFGERDNTQWEIIDGYLVHNSTATDGTICGNFTKDGSATTQNFTVVLTDDLNKFLTGYSFYPFLELDSAGTTCDTSNRVGAITTDNLGNVQMVTDTTDLAGFNIAGSQYNTTIKIFVDETNNRLNMTIYTAINTSGNVVYTEQGRVSFKSFAGGQTTAKGFRLKHDSGITNPNVIKDDIIACNITGSMDAMNCPFSITQTAPPNITIRYPINNTEINRTDEKYNYSASCTGTGLVNFTLKLSNSSNTILINNSQNNSTLLNLNGTYDISGLGNGLYISNFTCNDATRLESVFIVNNITDTQIFSLPNITIFFPLNNSVTNKSIVSEIALSSSCNYGISFSHNISNSTSTIFYQVNASVTYSNLSISSLLNISNIGTGIYDSIYRCSSDVGSDYKLYKINITGTLDFPAIVPSNATASPTGELFSLGSCPLSSILGVLVWVFLFAIAFVIMAFSYWFKHGLVGSMGAFILLIDSLYIFICLPVISIILVGSSFLLMFFFISRGSKGEL